MRHLSPRRLPLLAHDSVNATSSALRGVQPLSATTTSTTTSPAVEDALWSLSHTVRLPTHTNLFARLSRRQLRQREQRWGALWRYRPDAAAPPSPALQQKKEQAEQSPLLLGETKATSAVESASVVADDQGVASRSADTTQRGASSFGVKDEIQTATSSESGPRAAAQTSSPASVRPPPSETQRDPLLEFLETHGDDAADLLAMWTSLHRSCVYASELSESMVLQVRYFFHSLLRSRATAAAVEFYHRLMGLGVQLRESDVLLLFSSLTYEQAAKTEAEQLRKAQEDAAMEKDRRLWARRRAEVREAAQRHHEDQVKYKNAQTTAAKQEEEQRKKEGKKRGVLEEAGDTAVPGSEEQEAHPPSTIAHRVAFHQQPEWVKRWILYEASMGTLDGLDTPETASNVAKAAEGQHSDAEDAAWTFAPAAAAESALQSERAARAMELGAIVDHLRLLTLGAMQRSGHTMPHGTRGTKTSTTRRRSLSVYLTAASASAAERLYWREALRVVRKAFSASLWSSAQSAEPTVLPSDVAATLQCMMREASTWTGALAVLRLTATPQPPATRRRDLVPKIIELSREDFADGAVLFAALAASAQPWKTKATVEEWMHQHMLPRLIGQRHAAHSAAVMAISALWLSHLCGVKAGRPEDFIAMAEEAADYLPPASRTSPAAAEVLLHADLSALIADVQARSVSAVAALRRDVHEGMLARRAAEALAKSIRSGAYQIYPDDEDGDAMATRKSAEVTDAKLVTPAAAPPTSPSPLPTPTSALLSNAQMDAFVLCCAAVRETVWLRLSTAALTHRASATADVLRFLDASLYGSGGLHSLYSNLYCARRGSGSAPSALTAAAAAAPERPFLAVVVAVTLLEVAHQLCTPAHQRHRLGSPVNQRDTVGLLVDLARRAVDTVQPSHIAAAPWRWAVEARVAELVAATARTLHAVVREADVQPRNDKAMFGALPERDLLLLADLARLIIKTSDLATTASTATARLGRKRKATGCSGGQQCPAWRLLTATASPQVLWGVQLCFRKSSVLGRRVRQHLTSNEAQRLDALLSTSRRQRAIASPSHGGSVSAVKSRVPVFEAGVRSQTGHTDEDVASAIATRDAVYAAVRQHATTIGVRDALQEIASASTSWRTSLQLCHAVTKDVALARGTCNLSFFATVLTNATSHLAEANAAAAAAASRTQRSRVRRRDAHPRSSVGPPSLWLNALDVFWSAVDHTGGTPVSPTELLSTDGVALSEKLEKEEGTTTTADAQERAVLARLLLPLVEFSRAVQRVDVGRQWRRTWATKYTAQERQTAAFCRRNVKALVALGDAAALERCVSNYALLGHDEALLCHVAAEHNNWQQAFDALVRVFGSIEEKEAARSCYSVTVARTLLGLLARSEKNLSNTAMRLETLQGAAWDAECSAAVVRLLLRARRWSQALRHVEAALHRQPSLQLLHSRMATTTDSISDSTVQKSPENPLSSSRAPPPSLREALTYVTLLTLALQATAIGGDSNNAPLYYDAVKRTAASVFHTTESAQGTTDFADVSTDAPESGLEAAFAMTSAAAGVSLQAASSDATLGAEEQQSRAELSDLASRARLFFFRAMTKKMMAPKSSSSTSRTMIEMGHCEGGENEEDDVDAASTSDFWNDTCAEPGSEVNTL